MYTILGCAEAVGEMPAVLNGCSLKKDGAAAGAHLRSALYAFVRDLLRNAKLQQSSPDKINTCTGLDTACDACLLALCHERRAHVLLVIYG
jgi:hypothetical protein